ncbi:hypothetical protein [Paenibacillus sp. BIC5C1]|uniref:hypothetical protein n=1 Tax=Paenibacillus sp. BIC5C1 TaxID=3078263 RepID=UPI0028EAEE26|nr:hypothetical protein [Paenibacillus sp. BIC5C1]
MTLESSDWISIINIVATSILSISVVVLTARSTKASVKTTELTEKSVELSERAIRLNEEMNKATELDQRKYKNIIRFHYVNELKQKAVNISEIISTRNYEIVWNKLRDPSLIQTIPVTELALYFSKDEIETINGAWENLESIVKSFGGVFAFFEQEQTIRMRNIVQQIGIPISTLVLLLEDIMRQNIEAP